MKISDSRPQIQNAFIDLLIQKPIDKIKIKEITDLAGIARGTFYNHYDDVYALLEEIEMEILDQVRIVQTGFIQTNLHTLPDGQLIPQLYAVNQYIRNSTPKAHQALWGNYGCPMFQQKSKNMMREHLVGKLFFDHKITTNSKYISEFVVGSITSAHSLWINNNFELSAEEFTKICQEQVILPFYK